MIRVAVIDDHPVVTDGLAMALGGIGDIEIAWTAGTFGRAQTMLGGADVVDVVLVDIRLPDGSGLDLLPGERHARPAYIVLSTWDRPQYATAAFQRGAAGYLLKVAPFSEIVAAIRRAAAGGLAFDARHLDPVRRAALLTSREIEVVRLVSDGFSNDEIATRLGIARKTVEAYLTKIYARHGFSTRTELALWAERQGWLEAGSGS